MPVQKNKMQRILTKREKLILYTTVGVIVFSIAFNLLLAPIIKKNEDLNKKIKLAFTKLKKYTRLVSQKESIQAKFNEFSSTFGIPKEEEDSVVSALSNLENLAKNANIHIIDIRPQAPRTTGAHKEIVIDLRTEGTMEGYLKFIYGIEHSLSALTIKRFQLSAKPNTAALEGTFSISQPSLD